MTQNFAFMETFGKMDKFGTDVLILLFNTSILLPVHVCWVSENSADLDQMSCSAVSNLGLHCLLRPVVRIRRVSTVI